MEHPRIVIIGAGFAGLAAAQTLIQAGITDLCILEAKDRIGGRIHTQTYENMSHHVDIGAQWIHGEGSNPVYLFAKDNDLLAEEDESSDESSEDSYDYSYGSLHNDDRFYTEMGQLIPKSFAKETCDILNSILEKAAMLSHKEMRRKYAHDSMGVYFREMFERRGLANSDNPEVYSLRKLFFAWQNRIQNIENGCETLCDVSLNSWRQYTEFEGEEDVALKHGFKPIVALLANDIPPSSLHLEAEVRTIQLSEYSEENAKDNNSETPKCHSQIVISLQNGEHIDADYVIVTCSLGVLKAHAHSMFIPPLPKEKQMAIDRMGFGTVDKIFLQFEDPFWEPGTTSFQLLWRQDTDPPTQEADLWVPECLSAADLQQYGTWYRGIPAFDVVEGHPDLLCGWVAGVEANTMETVPDDVVIEVCLSVLRRFTGKAIEDRPTRMVRSSWHSDAHVLGSYSFIRAGSAGDNCDILCKPVPTADNPRIMFAGEATHREYFSTTHGAFMSGQREANRILAHLRDETL